MLTYLLNRWKEVHDVFTTQETQQLNRDKVTITVYPVFLEMFRKAVDLCGRAVTYLECVKVNHLNNDDYSFQQDLKELKQICKDICSSLEMGAQMPHEQTAQITKISTRRLRQCRRKPLRRSPRNH